MIQVIFSKGVFISMSPYEQEIIKIRDFAESLGYHTFTCGKYYYFGDTKVTAYFCYASEIKALVVPQLALWRER